jgi:hypothetical protein
MTLGSPISASVMNHTTMIGPNTVPMPAVPRDCTKKSPARITTVIGTTNGSNSVVAIPSPSTALNTEIAGVIMPSPYSKAAPNRPIAISRARPFPSFDRTSATSARMPPSPWLSARITNSRYFTDTVINSDQMISDSTPSTLPTVTGMACRPEKHSRSAYNGLVPISP